MFNLPYLYSCNIDTFTLLAKRIGFFLVTGKPGEKGFDGEAGAQGQKGDKGPVGSPGLPGLPGKLSSL